MPVRISRDLGERADDCVALARRLPRFFTESAVSQMTRDFVTHQLYVALAGADFAGFLSIHRESGVVAELSWIAVAPEHQRHRVGSALLDQAVTDLRASRFRFLKVKTLAPTVRYVPYDGTRAFNVHHASFTWRR